MAAEIQAAVLPAYRIAQRAHAGQVDKAGVAYFTGHVLDVWDRTVAAGGGLVAQQAALLHDVVEDTDLTLDALAAEGVDHDVLAVVDLLTRTGTIPSGRYYTRIREHPDARLVKLADIDSNTDPKRLALLDEHTRIRLTEKYAAARASLV